HGRLSWRARRMVARADGLGRFGSRAVPRTRLSALLRSGQERRQCGLKQLGIDVRLPTVRSTRGLHQGHTWMRGSELLGEFERDLVISRRMQNESRDTQLVPPAPVEAPEVERG